MDKEKQIIEAARALLGTWRDGANIFQLERQLKALEEALEDKPNRDRVVEHLQSIVDDFDHETIDSDDLAVFKDAIELLKQPTMQWVDSYNPNMTEYANGYAQAMEDGVGKPLTDDKDVQIVIDWQKKRINELVEVLKEIVAISDRKHDAWDRAKKLLTARTLT